MGRGGSGFERYWHHRQMQLGDGDTLRWLVVDSLPPAWIAYFRSDRRGGLHEAEGHRLLVEHSHADAGLGLRGDSPSRPLTG